MNLFIAASSFHQELEMCLAGLAWSDLPVDKAVIVVVDNTNCRPNTAKTLEVAERFASTHEPFDVCHAPVTRTDLSLGAGLAMQRAILDHPSDLYAYVDDDMFAVTRDWLPRLVRTREEHGTDISLGMTNVGMNIREFLDGIGSGLDMSVYNNVLHVARAIIPYSMGPWRETLAAWPAVVGWNKRDHGIELRSRVETPKASKRHLWSNSVVFSHEWFERRAHDDWFIRGETEMQLQIVKPGDTDNAAVDKNALLLHWGYTPARPALRALWPEVERKLKEHWCA